MAKNIIDHLKWRYATKKFDSNKELEPQKLEILLEAFNLTATSYGLQPIKLVVINNKDVQEKMVAHAMNQQQVAQASHVLVFCIESNIDKEYVETYFKRVKAIRNTPDAILDPFKSFLVDDFEKKPEEIIKVWAKNQAYLALGNLLTVCAVEGVDACPMEGFNPEAVDKMLELNKKGLHSVLLLPVGYRAEDDMFSELKKVRKSLNDSIIFFDEE